MPKITLKEYAKKHNVTPMTVHKWTYNGRIEFEWLGRVKFIDSKAKPLPFGKEKRRIDLKSFAVKVNNMTGIFSKDELAAFNWSVRGCR